jgi:hypothetical protein
VPVPEFSTGETGLIWRSYGVEATVKKLGSAKQEVAPRQRQAPGNKRYLITRKAESGSEQITRPI